MLPGRELSHEDREAVVVGRLAVALSLYVMAPYTTGLEYGWEPATMAAYIVKQAKLRGQLSKVWHAMGVE